MLFFCERRVTGLFSSSREESFGSGRDPITGEKYMDIFVAEFDKNGDPTGVGLLMRME